MHVVGDERAPVGGEAAGDRPVVAADGAVSINSQLPIANSQLPTSNAQQRRLDSRLPARSGEAIGRRVASALGTSERLAGAARSQVVDIGTGNGGTSSASPTIGESHSVPIGARKFAIASGSTSCIVPSVASYEPSGSCSVMNIDRTTSTAVFGEPLAAVPASTRCTRTAASRSRLKPLFTPDV